MTYFSFSLQRKSLKKEPGEPENICPIFDPGYLTNIIPCFVIDIYRLETVSV